MRFGSPGNDTQLGTERIGQRHDERELRPHLTGSEQAPHAGSGLSDYLTRFASSSTTLDDLVGCWSWASGQDLAGWAEQWLRAEGTTAIRLGADRGGRADLSGRGVLNDQDLSYTRTGFDVRSARVLAAAACQVGDPLSEAAPSRPPARGPRRASERS